MQGRTWTNMGAQRLTTPSHYPKVVRGKFFSVSQPPETLVMAPYHVHGTLLG